MNLDRWCWCLRNIKECLSLYYLSFSLPSFSFLPSWYNLQASVSVSLQYKCAVTPVCRCWLWRNKNVWSALLVFWPFRRECAVYPACVRICVVGECVAIRGTRFYFLYGPVAEPRQCPIYPRYISVQIINDFWYKYASLSIICLCAN